MRVPAFQLYAGDWLADPDLARCSFAAQGALMRAMCVLHQCEPYGVAKWPLGELAKAAGVPVKLLKECAVKGVLSGADGPHEGYVYRPRHAGQDGAPVTLIEAGPGPLWFVRRMVRDDYVRSRRGASTRFAAPNPAPNPAPTRAVGDGFGDGPSSSSSSSTPKNLQKKQVDGEIAPGLRERIDCLRAVCSTEHVDHGTPKAVAHLRQMAAEGITDVQLREAIRNVRDRPEHPASLSLSYLAPVVRDVAQGLIDGHGRGADAYAEAERRIQEREARNAAG